jgi:hypothetical protein
MESTLQKRGTLKKLRGTRPPIVRLVSSAEYTRTQVFEGGHGVPLNSTYRETLCTLASDAETATQRCIAARQEVARGKMVLDASKKLPLDVLDKVAADVDATMRLEASKRVDLAATAASVAVSTRRPIMTDKVATLAHTLSTLPRQPQMHTMVNEFFSSGPSGQVSELGTALAGSYWVEAARQGDTKLAMGKRQSKYAPGGNRLLNHNHMP